MLSSGLEDAALIMAKGRFFFFLKTEKLGLQGRRSGVCCSAKFKLGLTL